MGGEVKKKYDEWKKFKLVKISLYILVILRNINNNREIFLYRS